MSDATLDDEYEEYDEYEEDDDDERGLSGLVVLLMGVVMLGAVASVVWIAYKHGVRTGEAGTTTPYVSADPEEPLKIENRTADVADNIDREVYDRFDGEDSEPVEVIAAGPEEPVERNLDDPIGAIAGQINGAAEIAEDAVADRIASLEAADEAIAGVATNVSDTVGNVIDETARNIGSVPDPIAGRNVAVPDTAPSLNPSNQSAPVEDRPRPIVTASARSGDALSGSHLVQVGAFRSENEANGVWTRMQAKLGSYTDGKATDIEVADLGDKGTYYRLRIGPFLTSDAAKTYCEGLKQRGQDCLIRAKS